MTRLRILVLAPECNPEGLTNPSIGYHHAKALARMHEVTLVLHAENEAAVRLAGGPFHAIEPIRVPGFDQLYFWALKHIFKYDYGRQSLTAFSYPRHVLFELRAWFRLRRRIRKGAFDVVLRLLPYNRVLPSPFARMLRNGPVPFVVGPVSGGLPWATGFTQLARQKQQAGYWISNLRALAGYVPFARSTYADATAIIAGSSHTYGELAKYRKKMFFMPTEIGVEPAFFDGLTRSNSLPDGKLRLIFVGRLIPLKACDIALRGAMPLLRSGEAHFTIVGDGPERQRLDELVQSLGIGDAVSFTGWLPHPEVLRRLQDADVMVFPSLREIGGGVVFEALAAGAVPVVADFGGPGDLITPDTGCKMPLVGEEDLVSRLESVLRDLASDRTRLDTLRRQGMAYAREHLTWEHKANTVSTILVWATGRGAKPTLNPPQRMSSLTESSAVR